MAQGHFDLLRGNITQIFFPIAPTFGQRSSRCRHLKPCPNVARTQITAGFFDEFECVKIPRLRATGVVQFDAPYAIIQVGDRQKLVGLAHVRFRNGGSWSLFRCATCARRANRLWLIEDRPLCRHCCEGIGIVHRSKWGFGRRERLRTRDQKLDGLIAKLDATKGPLRFNPAPGSVRRRRWASARAQEHDRAAARRGRVGAGVASPEA